MSASAEMQPPGQVAGGTGDTAVAMGAAPVAQAPAAGADSRPGATASPAPAVAFTIPAGAAGVGTAAAGDPSRPEQPGVRKGSSGEEAVAGGTGEERSSSADGAAGGQVSFDKGGRDTAAGVGASASSGAGATPANDNAEATAGGGAGSGGGGGGGTADATGAVEMYMTMSAEALASETARLRNENTRLRDELLQMQADDKEADGARPGGAATATLPAFTIPAARPSPLTDQLLERLRRDNAELIHRQPPPPNAHAMLQRVSNSAGGRRPMDGDASGASYAPKAADSPIPAGTGYVSPDSASYTVDDVGASPPPRQRSRSPSPEPRGSGPTSRASAPPSRASSRASGRKQRQRRRRKGARRRGSKARRGGSKARKSSPARRRDGSPPRSDSEYGSDGGSAAGGYPDPAAYGDGYTDGSGEYSDGYSDGQQAQGWQRSDLRVERPGTSHSRATFSSGPPRSRPGSSSHHPKPTPQARKPLFKLAGPALASPLREVRSRAGRRAQAQRQVSPNSAGTGQQRYHSRPGSSASSARPFHSRPGSSASATRHGRSRPGTSASSVSGHGAAAARALQQQQQQQQQQHLAQQQSNAAQWNDSQSSPQPQGFVVPGPGAMDRQPQHGMRTHGGAMPHHTSPLRQTYSMAELSDEDGSDGAGQEGEDDDDDDDYGEDVTPVMATGELFFEGESLETQGSAPGGGQRSGHDGGGGSRKRRGRARVGGSSELEPRGSDEALMDAMSLRLLRQSQALVSNSQSHLRQASDLLGGRRERRRSGKQRRRRRRAKLGVRPRRSPLPPSHRVMAPHFSVLDEGEGDIDEGDSAIGPSPLPHDEKPRGGGPNSPPPTTERVAGGGDGGDGGATAASGSVAAQGSGSVSEQYSLEFDGAPGKDGRAGAPRRLPKAASSPGLGRGSSTLPSDGDDASASGSSAFHLPPASPMVSRERPGTTSGLPRSGSAGPIRHARVTRRRRRKRTSAASRSRSRSRGAGKRGGSPARRGNYVQRASPRSLPSGSPVPRPDDRGGFRPGTAGGRYGSVASPGASFASDGSPGSPAYGFGSASPSMAPGATMSSVFGGGQGEGGGQGRGGGPGAAGAPANAPGGGPDARHGEREWENEIARNILQLYRADVHTQAQRAAEDEAAELEATATAQLAAAGAGASPGATVVPVQAPQYVPRRRRSSLPKIVATSFDRPSTTQPVIARAGKPPDPTQATTARSLKRVLRLVPKPIGDDEDEGQLAGPRPLINIAGGGGGCKGFVRMRAGPYPIWYGGGGSAVTGRVVWCGVTSFQPNATLPTPEEEAAAAAAGSCAHKLCAHLAALEGGGKYKQYVELLRSLLLAKVRNPDKDAVVSRQWRQLVVTSNIFAVKYAEEGKYGRSLDMLKMADSLVVEDSAVAEATRKSLRAFIQDSYAYYYFRRGKHSAALQAARKAMRMHTSLKQYDHVAKCHLHTAAILSKSRRHAEAIRCMGQVLQLVDEEKLEVGGASAQKVCMLAVCYNNIAVEHLALRQYEDACVASQNSRRLARLSLSYSNRYLRHFETTHNVALAALHHSKEVQSSMQGEEHRELFKNLAETLYT